MVIFDIEATRREITTLSMQCKKLSYCIVIFDIDISTVNALEDNLSKASQDLVTGLVSHTIYCQII